MSPIIRQRLRSTDIGLTGAISTIRGLWDGHSAIERFGLRTHPRDYRLAEAAEAGLAPGYSTWFCGPCPLSV